MIFGNTAALLKFCQAYPKIKEINYGAVANKPGSKAFDQSVFLTPGGAAGHPEAAGYGH